MAFDDLHESERDILETLIKAGIRHGYSVSVNDGEEWTLRGSHDLDAIKAEIGHTDQGAIGFTKGISWEGHLAGPPKGTVSKDAKMAIFYLVHGNEEDVIYDHTNNESGLMLWREVEDTIAMWSSEKHDR